MGGEQGRGRGHADRRAEEGRHQGGGAFGHDHADEESKGQACEPGAKGDELVTGWALVEVGFDGVVEVFDELLRAGGSVFELLLGVVVEDCVVLVEQIGGVLGSLAVDGVVERGGDAGEGVGGFEHC